MQARVCVDGETKCIDVLVYFSYAQIATYAFPFIHKHAHEAYSAKIESLC